MVNWQKHLSMHFVILCNKDSNPYQEKTTVTILKGRLLLKTCQVKNSLRKFSHQLRTELQVIANIQVCCSPSLESPFLFLTSLIPQLLPFMLWTIWWLATQSEKKRNTKKFKRRIRSDMVIYVEFAQHHSAKLINLFHPYFKLC